MPLRLEDGEIFWDSITGREMWSWWRHQMEKFPHYWPFVWGINWSLANSPHKDQWYGALMLSLICAWINGWINNREAGDSRRHHAHYDFNVTVMMGMMWQFNYCFSSHCDRCVNLQLEPLLLWFIKGFENKQFVTSPCHIQKWKNHILQEHNKITCWCNM